MVRDEFGLIRRFFDRPGLAFARPEIRLGIGDDGALLKLGAGDELVLSVDMLQENVHFPAGCDASKLGARALLVNLSDLAAMGAEPLCFTLALSMPRAEEAWLVRFSAGLAQVAEQAHCPLVGGDTVRGPLGISIQVQGRVPERQALRRDGAAVGDAIYVTGTLGDAAAALEVLRDTPPARALSEAERESLRSAYYEPASRIRSGIALRGQASAAIDVSDGLAADLGHILAASGVAARIDCDALPLSQAFQALVPAREQLALALGGGDDYQLCFTVPPRSCTEVEALLDDLDVPLSRIGRIVDGTGISWLDAAGRSVDIPAGGYRHFREGGTE